MALGPLARIAVQIMMTAGGAIGRAAMEAYKEAAAGRGAAGAAASKLARRRMSLDEAKQILDVELTESQTKIQERFETLHKINEPREDFLGSPYLQLKVNAARSVMMEEIANQMAKESADKAKKGSDKSE
mmetsp:Transcript_96208/g.200973  ORF Transcript_96208/g.200973 Transcript_96208/m.200973 type:complete len:130 (+) Transcript_96208:223-612(+)|eukprot:CAMPEP_0206464832 /NCGR_PEP_ID=MMETSP0324_2-20121206/27452_1 /ASSEMBLY_ACC=CAM_ASM_000836 /TAXON_ID=2866 /ORGANISM="Crypthecodinium cohnii, Strain Seligo" /LENGTH=129 /DNA_ID=CAMNT_0053937541 /DNA_START=218 /DNA_END=607 /DNA_ORIENTATION=-